MAINILDSSIYNKIAAGEVIERPASVVKELLDNSIDAGSDDIKIAIGGGGLKLISVKDNGCGIAKADLKTAFYAHATSKINSEKDLYCIKTLGFRGEALCSIAAVSMVKVTSSVKGSVEGASIIIEGGNITSESECAYSGGTHITVENLFYNTPVRRKFLKTDKAEESEIINLVSRYILCNPHIRLSLNVNNKDIYQSSGKGIKETLAGVYGKDILDNITEIDFSREGMLLKGYICLPGFSKPNRTYQTLAVNGRLVVNGTVSAAVTAAYKDYLLKRQYPFYVLHLNVPGSFVDVNVHPNKIDVRFEDNKKIFNIFYTAINTKIHSNMQNNVLNNVDNSDDDATDTSKNNDSYTQFVVDKYNTKPDLANFGNLSIRDIYDDYTMNSTPNEQSSMQNKDTMLQSNAQNKDNLLPDRDYTVKGVLFDTYILLQSGGNILIIDQHAAHERLLYDKFLNEFKSNKSAVQYLMVPYLLNVNSREFEFLHKNIVSIGKLGFNIEMFGDNVFKVSAVPALFTYINLDNFFNDLLKDTDWTAADNTNDVIKERLIKKACRAAVKAGDVLAESDIQYIVNKLFSGTVLLCPHGRPVVLKYSKYDIEKIFKRKF